MNFKVIGYICLVIGAIGVFMGHELTHIGIMFILGLLYLIYYEVRGLKS